MEMILLLILAVVGLFIVFQFKHIQHKFQTYFVIALILVLVATFFVSMQGHNVNLTSVEGWQKAIGLYFSWVVHTTGNIGSLTSNAIKMDWVGSNSTASG